MGRGFESSSGRHAIPPTSAIPPHPACPVESRGCVGLRGRPSRRPVPLVESAPLENGERIAAFEPGELLFLSGCSGCRAATGDAGSPLVMSALPDGLADGVADHPAVRATRIGD